MSVIVYVMSYVVLLIAIAITPIFFGKEMNRVYNVRSEGLIIQYESQRRQIKKRIVLLVSVITTIIVAIYLIGENSEVLLVSGILFLTIPLSSMIVAKKVFTEPMFSSLFKLFLSVFVGTALIYTSYLMTGDLSGIIVSTSSMLILPILTWYLILWSKSIGAENEWTKIHTFLLLKALRNGYVEIRTKW